MIKKAYSFYAATMVLLFSLFSGCGKSLAEQNVAYFDLTKVLILPELRQQEKAWIDSVIEVVKQEETNALKRYENLEEEARIEALESNAIRLHKLLTTARRTAKTRIINHAIETAEAIGNINGLHLVRYGPLIFSGSDDIDITDSVIKELKESKIEFGPLPYFSGETDFINYKASYSMW
ncbi:hypothetical protein M8R90_01485 [Enterobacter hormaechei]|nr:hypothetical protein [Enterobacter hormaechei]